MKNQIMERPMTIEEKKKLASNIFVLPPEYLRGVWEIVTDKPITDINAKDELEFDIDSLSARKSRELERYVKLKI